MDWLKKLQEKYKAGKLTKEQYAAKVKELLEDGDLTQEEHDDALAYDPQESDKAIYTEADMQSMAYSVAHRMLRKELKKAGLDLDVSKAELVSTLVGLAKTGKESEGKGATATEQEIAQLRKDAGKVAKLEARVKDLGLHNAVMKQAAKYNPHSLAQVVRALGDYEDLIEYDDETGLPNDRSINSVLSKLTKTEPNLFQAPNGQDPDPEDKEKQGGFQGKPPGGASSTSGASGDASKMAALQAEALERMGFKKQ